MYGIRQNFFPTNQQIPGTSQFNPIQTQNHSVSIHGNNQLPNQNVPGSQRINRNYATTCDFISRIWTIVSQTF
jgi:hypothetical protein